MFLTQYDTTWFMLRVLVFVLIYLCTGFLFYQILFYNIAFSLLQAEKGAPTLAGKSKSESKDKERKHKKHKDKDKEKDRDHKKHKHRHKDRSKDKDKDKDKKKDKSGHHDSSADPSKKHHEKVGKLLGFRSY